MKPAGMSWRYFLRKNYGLWPLYICTAVGMFMMCGSIVRSFYIKDFIVTRGKFPWDKLDLLRKPYCRKLKHYHEEFDVLSEMACLYKEMDKKERERMDKKEKERMQRKNREEC